MDLIVASQPCAAVSPQWCNDRDAREAFTHARCRRRLLNAFGGFWNVDDHEERITVLADRIIARGGVTA